MELKKCVIVILAYLGGSCLAGFIIETGEQDTLSSHVADATVEVLASCYGDQVKATIIYGDSTGVLFKSLSSRQNLSVILMDSTTKLANESRPVFRNKLQIFTIVASSSTQLLRGLKDIKNSPWWNHMASFLILDWTAESSHECSKAFEFLWTAWEMNLLNAKFLCVSRTAGVLLYTYNPYTKKAPDAWKLTRTFRGKYDHAWSMFVRGHREAICEGLDFDKTGDLGGYVIPSSVKEMRTYWHTNRRKTGVDRFEGLEGTIARLYFRAMNANVKLLAYGNDTSFLISTDKGKTTGIVLDIVNGVSDIALNAWFQESLTDVTSAYPHSQSGLGVVTQYSGQVSQLSKINAVIDVSSRYGLYSVMLISTLFFKCLWRQALMPAILDTLRLACNSCLLRTPERTATRIYLATLFFFQITMLALYQGQLASLLTKQVYLKNVNTMEDLAELGHTIYGHKSFASYFNDPMFKGRFVSLETYDCRKYVMSDSSAACVLDYYILCSDPEILKHHLSGDVIIKSYNVYVVRDDWPLEQRFNEILRRMVQSDIIWRTLTAQCQRMSSLKRFHQKMRKEKKSEVITLSDLGFAFAILGIGMGFAALSFVFEKTFRRWRYLQPCLM